MPKEPDADELREALTRLMNENAKWRKKFDSANLILSRRSPNAAGLSLDSAIKTILDDRDDATDRVQFFRDEIRGILQYLLNSEEEDERKANELRKRINQFLFNNPR